MDTVHEFCLIIKGDGKRVFMTVKDNSIRHIVPEVYVSVLFHS